MLQMSDSLRLPTAGERQCTKCHECKPEAEFSQRLKKGKQTRWCDLCLREYWVNLKYDLAPGQFRQMLADQNGLCKTCGLPPANAHLCVDHDHETGEVRGLLCDRCNTVLGMLNDDPALLQAMIIYLQNTGI